MPQNLEDLDLANAERDADPIRFHGYDPSGSVERNYSATHSSNQPTRQHTQTGHDAPVEEAEEPQKVERGDSSSTVDGGDEGARRRHHRPSMVSATSSARMEEMFMNYLERHPTAIRRIQDHRLQHLQTVGAAKVTSLDGKQMPAFGGGKPYPPPLPEKEEYVVEFEGHGDAHHSQNWPLRKKITVSAITIYSCFSATLASSIFSDAATYIGKEFHVGREVTTLGTSLFVLGYALGPIIWAPMSELYGRKMPILVAAFAFGIFEIGVAVAKDYQTIMICRFFAGLFGASPLTIVAAILADMWNNRTRGIAIAAFGACVINGPLMGPFIGGFISKSYLGWRWTAYIPAFMGFFAGILILFFVDESYGPVILVSKAAELRRLTRNWGIHAKQEEVEVDFKELVSKNISRPLRILFTEPIAFLVTFYMSFIYGLLYLSLTAYGIVFGEIYGFSVGVSGLPFFGMIVGCFLGFFVIVLEVPFYNKKLAANNDVVVPEWRMPITMVGGIIFAIGLFWFGWTGFTSSVPWIVPTLAGLFLGFGIFTVFLQCLNYIIDSYLMFSASAIAANTFMRSLFGAIFPLWGYYMFAGIGIEWGMTFLGCMATVCVPLPFVFYFYGKKIRAKSKIAPAPDIEQDKRRDEESRAAAAGGEGGSSEDSGTTNGMANGNANGTDSLSEKKEE